MKASFIYRFFLLIWGLECLNIFIPLNWGYTRDHVKLWFNNYLDLLFLVLYPNPANKYPYTDRSWQTSNRRRWSWLCHSWWRPQSNGTRQEIHGQTLRGALLTLRARERSHTEPTARLNHTTRDNNVPWQPYEQKLQLSAASTAASGNVAKPVHKLRVVVRWFQLGR